MPHSLDTGNCRRGTPPRLNDQQGVRSGARSAEWSGRRSVALRHPGSLLLHSVDRWAANPSVALFIVAADVLWVLGSIAFGFPGRWETVFQAVVAAVTMAMVFIIQHTQAREQAATSANSTRSSGHSRARTMR
jgi:Low affinity iron permease